VHCSVWQCVALCGSVSQCVAVLCQDSYVPQYISFESKTAKCAWQYVAVRGSVWQCVVARDNVLQCVAACCSLRSKLDVLRCVAVLQ